MKFSDIFTSLIFPSFSEFIAKYTSLIGAIALLIIFIYIFKSLNEKLSKNEYWGLDCVVSLVLADMFFLYALYTESYEVEDTTITPLWFVFLFAILFYLMLFWVVIITKIVVKASKNTKEGNPQLLSENVDTEKHESKLAVNIRKFNKMFRKIVFPIAAIIVLAFVCSNVVDNIKWQKIGDGFKTITLKKGTYNGNILSSELSGMGNYVLNTGSSYNGEWVDSTPNGSGILKLESLGTYEGEFVDGKREGKGTFTWENGDYVSGTWKNDNLIGNFILSKNNWQFECSINDENYLISKLIYVGNDYSISWNIDTNLEEFDLATCRSNCEATFVNNEGTTITGYLTKDNFNGDCVVEYSNGDVYKGNLVDGLRSGYGIYTWNSDGSGAEYRGDWQDDMMNGEGIYYYEGKPSFGKGDNYLEGGFLDNFPNGECTCSRNLGTNTNGMWKTLWENKKCISVEKIG